MKEDVVNLNAYMMDKEIEFQTILEENVMLQSKSVKGISTKVEQTIRWQLS